MLTKAPRQSNTTLVSHIDCPGGGQVWVEGTTLYVGHMRPTSGTTIIDIADPRAPRILAQDRRARGLALAQGAGRQRHHDRQPGEVRKVVAGRRRRRHRHLRRHEPGEPEADLRVANRRRRRAPFRFRRPLRLYLADCRRLRRQHRDDPRSRRSGEAGRSEPLVDTRPVAGRRRGISVGRLGARRAAIIRCATATGSMSATGTTASSFSTSADLSKPKLVSHYNTSPSFPHPTHTCLVMPKPLKGRNVMVVADEDVAKLWPARAVLHLGLRHHQGAAAGADLDFPGAGPRYRTAARSRR